MPVAISTVSQESRPGPLPQRERIRTTVDLLLSQVAGLGRFSPCAEIWAASLAVMNDSHPLLVKNGMEAAADRSYTHLHAELASYRELSDRSVHDGPAAGH